MTTVEPRLGAFFRFDRYMRTVMIASCVVTVRYARMTYVTCVLGSLICVRTVGNSMCGLLFGLSSGGAYTPARREKYGHHRGFIAVEIEGAHGAEVCCCHAVDSDRVEGLRA